MERRHIRTPLLAICLGVVFRQVKCELTSNPANPVTFNESIDNVKKLPFIEGDEELIPSKNKAFVNENRETILRRLSFLERVQNSYENKSLTSAVTSIINEELKDCALVVAFDKAFRDALVLSVLLTLSRFIQVVEVSQPEDFSSVLWESVHCRGYIFLLGNPIPLFIFTDEAEEPWDYHGRYLLAGIDKYDLDFFTSTVKGKNTEYIAALCLEEPAEWRVYMNQLYWGEGMVPVNIWRRGNFTTDTKIFPRKTWNLKGAPLTLYTFQFEPHVLFSHEGGEERIYGRDIQIADTLAHVLNFTLVIKKSPASEFWGFPDGNGSWNGMNGNIQRNEGHFGMAYAFLTDNDKTMEAVDFSQFYDSDVSCFMARTEPPLPHWLSLAAPFQLSTWMAFFIGILIFSPILYMLARGSTLINEEEVGELLKLSSAFLYSWGIHMQETQYRQPRTASARVCIASLWIYTIIMTTVYSSNLIAFLTVARPRASMETVSELHASGRDVMGIGCYFYASFEQSKNAYIRDFVNRYVRLTEEIDFDDFILSGRGVFVETRTYQEYVIVANYTKQGVPSMRIMKECYKPQSIAITLQRHFPAKESFNIILGWLFDNGLLHKWHLDTLRQIKQRSTIAEYYNEGKEKQIGERGQEGKVKGENEHNEVSDGVTAFTISHMQGIFYIYIVCLGFSSLLFFMEVTLFNDN